MSSLVITLISEQSHPMTTIKYFTQSAELIIEPCIESNPQCSGNVRAGGMVAD